MKVSNIFQNIPKDFKEEFFENLLENDHFRIERIVSLGNITPKGEWLVQEETEFVLLLSGAAKLIFFENNETVDMKAGDYILIPIGTKHRVDWTDESECSFWIAVHFK
ncbi:MAG: cupin domain-containing protein [Ignavibacteria bacterium]|nr:cupin domain-containing protein [Ignavibacteria bacterium]